MILKKLHQKHSQVRIANVVENTDFQYLFLLPTFRSISTFSLDKYKYIVLFDETALKTFFLPDVLHGCKA